MLLLKYMSFEFMIIVGSKIKRCLVIITKFKGCNVAVATSVWNVNLFNLCSCRDHK